MENRFNQREFKLAMSLFNQVRAACEDVSRRATSVRINYNQIPPYAKSLSIIHGTILEFDPNRYYLGQSNDTVAFFLTLNAISFGSGYFPSLHKRPSKSGSFTIAASLNDYFKNHGAFSAQELTELTTEDCTRIFGQDRNNVPIGELMRLFTTALNNLGRYLLDYFEGSFMNLVEAAEASAEHLVRLLIKMPFFNDVQKYNELDVPFYKRAQLTAADLALAFHGEGPGRFDDLGKLTMFADNLVPHVLRVDSILIYEEALATRIEEGQLIPAHSSEEVEIRACALHAVELVVKTLRDLGYNVTSRQLDLFLWNRGQQPYYKKIHPRHRTRTIFY